MYLTVKQQVKHLSKEDYRTIKELCHTAKNLTNEAMREIIIKEGYSIWNLAKEGTEHDRTIKKALRIS